MMKQQPEQIGLTAAAALKAACAPEELELVRELARLPEEIRLAAAVRDPSRLNRYAASVAGVFHRFYTACRIKGAESEAIQNARIGLVKCVATVIENTLSCLGVSAPEHM